MLVYKFTCAACGASNIGETRRHFKTRMDEHLKTDKNSHIYKHLNGNTACFNALNNESFSILDRADSNINLKIKEALHINWEKPNLNAQVNHYFISLSI